MAKGGDNIILWLLLLGGGLFYIYHRHDNKEDEGTGPTATPAVTGARRYRQTVLPPHNYHAPPPVNQLPPIIPPSGGFGCPSCPPGMQDEGYGSYFTYAPGDRVNSWFDADEHTGMYAVPMQKSYGDVASIF